MKAQKRRGFMQQLIKVSSLTAGLGLIANGNARSAESDADIVQPLEQTPDHYMQRALAMRQLAVDNGDQAFGAVIVKNGHIVGQAPSRVITASDPTAHAEMEAIRDAARRLGTRRLHDCVMYSSSPPCPMCRAGAYWAGIEGMVSGAQLRDGGKPYLC